MSGAEAILVLGVISSIIAIVDGTNKVFDAATSTEGLPKEFRDVAARLPIVTNILSSAMQHIERKDVDEESCKGVKQVVEACEKKAKALDDLFRKVIPADGASRQEVYTSAVRTLGKGSRVEALMKGILEDVQLLSSEHGMKSGTTVEKEQLTEAIAEVLKDFIPGKPILAGSDEEKCMSALFLTNPHDDREQLVTTKGLRVEGTCEWIKDNSLYEEWFHSRSHSHSHSQLLWISGGPGKGKTMLSIFLAKEFEQTAKSSPEILSLQYFCDNKDEKRNTAVTIVRGLIFQLLEAQPKLFDHIIPSFKIQKESLFTDSSLETLWRIFSSMICDPVLNNVYCVLDGLDECDETSLEVLLKKFKTLFSPGTSSSHHLKIAVVSRDLPDIIPELLSGFPRIRLDPDSDTEVNNDIQRFIDFKVDKLSRDKQYPEQLRIHVKQVFQNRAQGTFLWVGLVANALRKYKPTEVEKALDIFPSGLDELYARLLLQIPDDRREIAAKILRWVVLALRPLSLSELGAAVGIDIKPSTGFDLREVTRDQVSSCGYFLTIKNREISYQYRRTTDNDKEEVGLIHQSAKDYLLRKTPDSNVNLEFFRVKEETGNLEITRKCLKYLQNGALVGGDGRLTGNTAHLKAFPLLLYAVLYWPEHAKSLARSEDIFDLSLPFYHKKSPVRKAWQNEYEYTRGSWDRPIPVKLLHLASYFGIIPIVKNILFDKSLKGRLKGMFKLNKKDDRRITPLMYAVSNKHKSVVQLLLKKGADMEARSNKNWTALIAAARGGDEAIVRLLLENGADIEAGGNDNYTALIAAARGGDEAIVRLLLENGADIEAGDNDNWTTLIAAAQRGDEAIVRLLLDKGANIEARSNDNYTAIIFAARGGHKAMVRLLLEKGANIKARGNDNYTALIAAARGGNKAIVRLLLEKGADIEARSNNNWTALIAAAWGGDEAIVRLLLENGADIEARGTNNWTALIAAARGGDEAIVRLLLEKGANIEARDNDNWTALIVAACWGHEAMVRLLLDKEVEIGAKNDDIETALKVATERRRRSVVKLLEDFKSRL